jgi:hypothetical protein
MKVVKAIAALLLNSFVPSLSQRKIWNNKRQPSDDNIGEGLALNIHALPKTINAKKNPIFRSPELIQHTISSHALALSKQREAALPAPRFKHLSRALQELITGKKYKCAAL